MSMGEPTRRLNVVEVDEPPEPPTLGERWGRLPAAVQATAILAAYGTLTGVIFAILRVVWHQGLNDALENAFGASILVAIVWAFVWVACLRFKEGL